MRLEGQKLKGKCFCKSDTRLMMPAFGTFTGGLDCEHSAISRAMESAYVRYLICHDRVWLCS